MYLFRCTTTRVLSLIFFLLLLFSLFFFLFFKIPSALDDRRTFMDRTNERTNRQRVSKGYDLIKS